MKSEVVERMCIACRAVKPARELLRFVCNTNGEVFFDVRGQISSRGAYTCATPECLQKAIMKNGFGRAFEQGVHVNKQTFLQDICQLLTKHVLGQLGMAFKSRHCIAGRTEALLYLQNHDGYLIVSHDLSDRSSEELIKGAAGKPVLIGPSKEEIGKALGRAETGVVALIKGRITDQIFIDLKRLEQFLVGFKECKNG